MREVARKSAIALEQILEGLAQVSFKDQLFVVLEMNEQRELAEAGEHFAKEPHVFAGSPGVHDLWRAAVREQLGPVAIDVIEKTHRVSLFAELAAGIFALRNGDRASVAKESQLVREIVHVHGAVGAEVVIKDE